MVVFQTHSKSWPSEQKFEHESKIFKIFRGGKFLKYHFELIHLSYSETETGANVAHGIGIHYLISSLFVIHPTWPAIWWESIWYRTHFYIRFIFLGWNWVNNRWTFANHSLEVGFKLMMSLESLQSLKWHQTTVIKHHFENRPQHRHHCLR